MAAACPVNAGRTIPAVLVDLALLVLPLRRVGGDVLLVQELLFEREAIRALDGPLARLSVGLACPLALPEAHRRPGIRRRGRGRGNGRLQQQEGGEDPGHGHLQMVREQAPIIFCGYSRHHAPMALTLTEALRLAAASQLLVVVGLLLRDHRRSRITAASSLLAACVVCYLALPLLLRPGAPLVLRPIAGAGAFAVPFAFWLAARLYFEDDFLPRPVHGLLLLGWLAARAAVVPWPLAVSAIGAAAVVDALRRIHSGSSSDLLLSRLRLRYATLLGTGIYALR